MASPDPRARLLDLAEERGLSLAGLSALIGRNPTYLQQFVRKGSPRRLEERDRRKLAAFLGVDEGELGAPEEKSHNAEAWLTIPRLDAAASAGPGGFGSDEQVGALRFSAAWLRGQGLQPAMLSAIAVAGDSMEPLLRDGDEILVDRTPRAWRDGIYVVRVDGALLVKRVQTGIPGRIVLESANPAYRPIELPAAMVEPVGRVVWKGGRV